MSTLSNVTPKKDGKLPSRIGLTANVLPEKSKEGVSVRYAQDANKQWFVLRATYHREKKAYDYLIAKGIEAFIPFHRTLRLTQGKHKFVVESYLPSFLFVYATAEVVKEYVENTPELPFLSYYYNHFVTTEEGKNPPLTVPYDSMMNFIKVASVDKRHVKVISPEQCHYKNGDLVKVIYGEFKGVVGKVARVSGQQRVVVEIEGVCLISTAYIPNAFIEKIKNDNSEYETS